MDVHPEVDDAQLSQSTVSTYLGIDKRDGLVSIGKRLVQGKSSRVYSDSTGDSQEENLDVDLGGLGVSWQKTFQESDRLSRSDGGDTLALSAFMLSSLPDALARKNLVKEIWQSGADVMVSIHNFSVQPYRTRSTFFLTLPLGPGPHRPQFHCWIRMHSGGKRISSTVGQERARGSCYG